MGNFETYLKPLRGLGIGRFLLYSTQWLKKKYHYECIWNLNTKEKFLYLTFDDGPNPNATNFVLKELKKFKAKATFFCIGKNVAQHFDIFKKIIEEGHAVGNHTYDHLNSSETDDKVYLDNISKAQRLIKSNLFRPPFGTITKFLAKQLRGVKYGLKPIMWTVSSQDFDNCISAEDCYHIVIRETKKGSIVLFHDTEFAMDKLLIALPKILNYYSKLGYEFKSISL